MQEGEEVQPGITKIRKQYRKECSQKNTVNARKEIYECHTI